MNQNRKKKQELRRVPRNRFSTQLKFFDTSINSGLGDLTFNTTGLFLSPSLNIVPTGSLQSQRVGRRIHVLNIEYQLDLAIGYLLNTNVSNSGYKISFVRDRSPNGALASYGDVYSNMTLSSFQNVTNIQRFKILKSIVGELNSGLWWDSGTSQIGRWPNTQMLQGSIKVNDIVDYGVTDTTGAVASTAIGLLSVLCISDNTAITALDIGSQFRIWYYDIN